METLAMLYLIYIFSYISFPDLLRINKEGIYTYIVQFSSVESLSRV